MSSVRARVPWAALAAALAMLFFAGRLVQDLRDRLVVAERRAAVAEQALATATVQLATASAALATATAAPIARLAEARAALEQILQATLAAFRDPSPEQVAALSTLYDSQPLAEVMPEIDHLRSQGLRLGGRSGFVLDVREADVLGSDRARIRTQERWTYDELNAQGQSVRCVQDLYSVAYILQRQDSGWRIAELTQEAPRQRQAC